MSPVTLEPASFGVGKQKKPSRNESLVLPWHTWTPIETLTEQRCLQTENAF